MIYKKKKKVVIVNSRNPLQTLEWNTSRHPNGRFSVFVVAHALVESLAPGSLIHCELRIPGTGYVKKRSLLYYPTGELISVKKITNFPKKFFCTSAKRMW